MSAELYRSLNLDRFPVTPVADSTQFGRAGIRPGDRVYFANFALLRKKPWQPDNRPAALDELVLAAGTAQLIALEKQGDVYARPISDGRFVLYVPGAGAPQQLPVITASGLPLETASGVFGSVDRADTVEVIGVPVDYLCQADNCFPL